jgi:hypothetical protein
MAEYQLPSVDDFENAEHCVLEDVTEQVRTLTDPDAYSNPRAREISQELELRDMIRGRTCRICLYTEGLADVEVESRAQPRTHERFNLRFLHPTPQISRHCPVLLLKIAGGFAGLTVIAALLKVFGVFEVYTLYTAIACGVASIASFAVAYYRTHQKFVFKTLHGRAEALRLVAGFGTGFRARKVLPRLTQAIAAFSGTSDGDNADYLRAEMHEHYRLRKENILTAEECSDATSRLLNKFDAAR